MFYRSMRCSKTCLFVLENMFGMGLMDGKYYIGELAYPLDSAVKASLVLEDSAFAGKGKPFTHLVLATDMQPVLLHTKYVFFGIQITTDQKTKNTGYFYPHPVQINSLLFYQLKKEETMLIEWINDILIEHRKPSV